MSPLLGDIATAFKVNDEVLIVVVNANLSVETKWRNMKMIEILKRNIKFIYLT